MWFSSLIEIGLPILDVRKCDKCPKENIADVEDEAISRNREQESKQNNQRFQRTARERQNSKSAYETYKRPIRSNEF